MLAPLEAPTVGAAVRVLSELLIGSGAVHDPAAVAVLWDERRIRDVIHIGDRVLLPHLRTDAVTELVAAVGVSARPLPLRHGDQHPAAEIIVLVLAPIASAGRYLQTVAALARALRRDHVVDALAQARSPAEVLATPDIWNIPIPAKPTVRDVMASHVHCVAPDTPVRDALELVSRHGLHAVPVVGEQREVLGMVTDRDLLRHILTQVRRDADATNANEAQSSDVRVREIMSRSVMCISEDQGLTEVASILVNKDVERLPVVSDGRLTGFLTRGDLIRKYLGSY